MVKMEVMFKNGIAVSDLGRLHNLIKKYGGEGVFVPLKKVEAQNTSDNIPSMPFIKQCTCGKRVATVHLCDECFRDAVTE